VFSDSGTFSEEGVILGFAGILLRTSTERPEVLDKSMVVVGDINSKDIEQTIELAKVMQENNEPTALV
jgi:UDP-N-acetylglucosamine 2-epimerase (non-hydrolysing)